VDLRKRLASLDKLSRKPAPDTQYETETPGPFDAAQLAVEALGFESVPSALGFCHVRKYRDEVSCPLAIPDLGGFFTQNIDSNLEISEVLFLDTETTGLVGGTGTIAFLVGVSWFELATLHTWQFFLCSPANEPAMLEQLQVVAERFKAVATFNGASFDLPLLKTRALLNRMRAPWDNLTGLDLLVPARRLWSRQLENCRQQTVEKEICQLKREGQDIEGHLIPQTWFDFLKLGRTQDMSRVLYHNHRDMLGMAHILGLVAQRAQEINEPAESSELPWQQSWALGRIAEMRADKELSINWMKRAWDKSKTQRPTIQSDPRFVQEALRILKRSGDWELVEGVISRALAHDLQELWLHREAAILYEHRLVDLPRARQHASAAGDDHRLSRLNKKLGLC